LTPVGVVENVTLYGENEPEQLDGVSVSMLELLPILVTTVAMNYIPLAVYGSLASISAAWIVRV
jgi:hypothetical protein